MTEAYNRRTEKDLRRDLRRNMPDAEVIWSDL